MKTLSNAALAATLLLTGCGSTGRTGNSLDTTTPSTPANERASDADGEALDDGDQVIADYRALLERMCACADAACGEVVKADAARLEQEARDGGIEPTAQQEAEFEHLELELKICWEGLAQEYK